MKAHVPFATILVLFAAGTTLAADGFTIGAIDAGGVTGSNPSSGLSIVGGTIYQSALGSDFEPSQGFIGFMPELQWDSYVSLDRGPVEPAPGYNGKDVATPGFAPSSGKFTATSLTGAWFVTGVVASFENTSTGLHEVFVARITHTGTLTGFLGTVISEDNNVSTRTVGSGLGATFDSDTSAGSLEESYTWIVREQTVDIGGTEYTVSDLYLQQGVVPTPGAMALLGVGGVAATRRRRR